MTTQLGSAYGVVKIDVSGVQRAAQQTRGAFDSMERGFLGIAVPVAAATSAVEIFSGVLDKIGDVVGSVAEGMVGGNKQFEQYETSFKVLIGNAELARERLEELADFGARTPFELPGVVEADTVLQSFGLHAPAVAERYRQMGIDIRTVTGDVAAGVNVDMKQIALNIGKFSAGATGEAIMRFQELGIVTRDEMRAMGIEFSKSGEMISPLPEAMDVLLQIMHEKFGGMMDAQSATMGGMLSNLIDWKDNTLRELGEPIFEVLKDKLASLLEFLGSSSMQSAIAQFSDLMRNALNILMDFISSMTGGVNLESFADSFANGLQKVNSFLTELRDRLRGFTVSDVMNELAGSIEAVQSRLDSSLSELETNYNRTVTQINAQIENAGIALGEQLVAINEKYAAQATKVNERFAETKKRIESQLADARINFEERVAQKRQALQERLENMERQFAEKRRAINEQIQDKIFAFEEKREQIRENLEDKLSNLSESHESRRAKLIEQMNKATTAEERAEIQARLNSEDTEYNKQAEKLKERAKKEEERAKRKHDRAVKKLKERLAREEQAYKEQVEREKKRTAEDEARMQAKYDRQVAKLNQRLTDEDAKRQEQLAKIFAERDAETAKAQEEHDKQVAMLQERLVAEEQAYRENREKIIASAQEDIAELEAQAAARAQALSEEATGAVAQVLNVVNTIKDVINELQPVFDFLKEHSAEIKGIFIGLAAVLAGAGIVAAITAIASAVATLFSPLGALIAVAALLGAAWVGNWFGIQEKTQAVIDTIWPIMQSMWAWITETAIPTIQEWGRAFAEGFAPYWDAIVEKFRIFSDNIKPKLEESWNKLLEVWAAVKQIYDEQLKPALTELAEKLGLNDKSTSDLFLALGMLVGGFAEWQLTKILNDIGLALDVVTFAIDRTASAFRGANNIISAFKDKWETLKGVVEGGIEFPDILTPGSPTPLETGFRGIADSLNAIPPISKVFTPPDLSAASRLPLPAATAQAAGNVDSSTSNTTTVDKIEIIIQGAGRNATDIGAEVDARLSKLFGLAQSGALP